MSGYDINLGTLRIAAMLFLLGPLIIILGTADAVTNGRSRNWPLGEKPRDNEPS